MKKAYLGILALAALPPTMAVAAQHHHVSGAGCISSNNNAGNLLRGAFLINWDTTAKQVSCPVAFTATSAAPVSVNPSAGRVEFNDMNGVAGTGGAISCYMSLMNTNGTDVRSGTLYSCGTTGGCATADVGWSGVGNLNFADTIGATANTIGLSFYCTIPAYESGPSQLWSVAFSTSAP